MLESVPVLLGLGLIVAVIATMAGIGGGVFMVPLFYFLGLSIRQAIGTSKFVIVFISFFGAYNYLRMKKVPVKTGLYVLTGMIPASYFGAYVPRIVDQNILKIIVSLFIIYYSVRLMYSYMKKQRKNKESSRTAELSDPLGIRVPPAKAVLIGLFSGLIAGLTGTGGGAVNMPLFIGVLGIHIRIAVALSTFTIFPSAVAATIRHVLNGDIVYDVAFPFIAGAVIGANIGPRLASKISSQTLRLFIGVILSYIGIYMFYSSVSALQS